MTPRRPLLHLLGSAVVAVVGAFALAASLAAPAPALANGVPTLVQLSYIDLSNWGPEDASGLAELIFAEGIVRVDAEGLPVLDEQRYHGWLVNSEVGDAISVGTFNADAEGVVDYEGTLPAISDFGFDLFILTVEPAPDDAPQPSEHRSIGGYFELVGQPAPDAEGGDGAGALLQPGELPNTGYPGVDYWRLAMLLGVMLLSVAVGVRMGRRTS